MFNVIFYDYDNRKKWMIQSTLITKFIDDKTILRGVMNSDYNNQHYINIRHTYSIICICYIYASV